MKFKRRLLVAAIAAALGAPAGVALATEDERPDYIVAPEAETDEQIWAPERRAYAEPSAEAVPPGPPPGMQPHDLGGLEIHGDGMDDPARRAYAEPTEEAVPPGPPASLRPPEDAQVGALITEDHPGTPARGEPAYEMVPPGLPAGLDPEPRAERGFVIEEQAVAEVEPADEPVARPAPTPTPAEPRDDDVARAPEPAPAPAPAPTPAAPQDQVADEPPVTDELVRDLQQALRERGHDPGPIDGIWGPQTEQALADFQREQDMDATGQMDAETVAELDLEE